MRDKRKLSDLSEDDRQKFAEQIEQLFRPIMEKIDKVPLGEVRQLRERLGELYEDVSILEDIPLDELLRIANEYEFREQSKQEELVKKMTELLRESSGQSDKISPHQTTPKSARPGKKPATYQPAEPGVSEPNFGKRPDVRKRRKWIYENREKIINGDLTPLQIAEQWHTSERTITKDRQELGILFRDEK